MWQSEFPLPCDGPAPRSDLTAIDHVAQTMQYEEFLSWLLYYTALFDMGKTPQLEIADPMGIVYSQAVESPGRGVRFTLNGSMAANALSTVCLTVPMSSSGMVHRSRRARASQNGIRSPCR